MKKRYLDFFELIKSEYFIRLYCYAVGIAIVIDWLLFPLFTKYMGIYAPLSLISVYYIVSELSGYIEHYFEKTKAYKFFLALVISDIVQVLGMSVYFYNIEYFTYLMMLIFSFQALLYEIYSIKAMQFIEKYTFHNVSKFQSFLLFNKSNMIVFSLLFGMIYFLVTDNYDYLIGIIILFSFLSISLEIKLYKYVRSVEETTKTSATPRQIKNRF